MKALDHHRARRFRRALTTYNTAVFDITDCVVDLLTDARHWCDRHARSFAELDRLAYQHYVQEAAEAREEGL